MPTRSLDKDPLYSQLVFSLPMREGTGTAVVADVARPHHPVTQVHAPVWTQLPSGIWVMDFDGTNDYLQCPAASSVDLNFTGGDFSAAVWAYKDAQAGCLFCRGIQNGDGWILSSGNSQPFMETCQVGTRQSSYGPVFSLSTWALISFSRSGTSVRLYHNGWDGTSTAGVHTNPLTSARNLYIGEYNTLGVVPFNGRLWNPRIWGRALSPAEHRQLFLRERHLFNV